VSWLEYPGLVAILMLLILVAISNANDEGEDE